MSAAAPFSLSEPPMMMDRRTAVRVIGTTSVWSLLALTTACKRRSSSSGVITNAANQPAQQPAASVTESVKLPGGRVMDVMLGGDPVGYPLVLHHGTPGDMTSYTDWHALCRDRGLRLIIASRPRLCRVFPDACIVQSQARLRTLRPFWIGLDTNRS